MHPDMPSSTGESAAQRIAARIARCDWAALGDALDARGYARVPRLLTAGECRTLARLWHERERFRSHVDMASHRFGLGAYRYFASPLPPLVEALRRQLYPPLAGVANRWAERLGSDERFPPTLKRFLARCHEQEQRRPTPLLLRYEAGGYNCLHQDLYGPVVFPLQVAILLSDPRRDFTGGELLLVEQRPRMQSRGEALALARGDALVFATRERPVKGTRGWYRTQLRHGVSTIASGERSTLGIIFHDAR
jgi:hypothetical protein